MILSALVFLGSLIGTRVQPGPSSAWQRARNTAGAKLRSLSLYDSGGWKCALLGVPWRWSVSARWAWGDIVSFNMLSKVLKILSMRRQGTPMRAHLQLPDLLRTFVSMLRSTRELANMTSKCRSNVQSPRVWTYFPDWNYCTRSHDFERSQPLKRDVMLRLGVT